MDFADKFLDMVVGQKTGALDAREGKKRWVFYFQDGRLALTKSNIRSEQGAALKEANPEKSAAELIHLQSVMRLLKGSGQLCKHAVLEDAPTKISNISGNDVFIETYSQYYTVEDLERKCADIVSVKLKLISDPDFENSKYTEFLNTFEGLLTTATMVARGNLYRKEAWATIWLTWKLGLVEQEAKDEQVEVFDFDLDDVLADLGDQEGSPALNKTPIAQEPEIEEPVEDDTPKRHPMADQLERLSRRIEQAETHFDVLGLTWEAPVEEFKSAYRDLSLNLHPDRYVDATEDMQETATRLFDRAREAWDVIGDDDQRKAYIDSKIHGIKTEEEEAMEALQAIWAAEESFKRGLALFNQGRIAQAHENFSKAVELNPEDLEPKAYFGYTSFNTLRNTNPERAMEGIEIIREAIELNQLQERKLDSAWMLIGKAYREMGQTDKAKRALTQALRLNPSNSAAKIELRRASGAPAKGAKPKPQEKEEKKGGFFGRWGKKK